MSDQQTNAMDRMLDRLTRLIQDRRNPAGWWQKIRRWLRGMMIGINAAYGLGLLALLIVPEWVGERHWLAAFFLYTPAQAWLLPLLVLAPFTLWLCRRWLWLHLACLLLVAFGFYRFHWSWRRAPKGPVVTVMTNNIGQNNRQSFTGFLNQETPDLIALQDATRRAGQYVKSYTNYQGRDVGEFALLSRFPIRGAGLLPLRDARGYPVAAWFEIEFNGGAFILYNVHLPSPRSELYRLKGLGMPVAIAGMGQEDTRPAKYRQRLEEAWAARIKVARELAEVFAREQRPFLVAGDFNMPNRGYLHRLFSGRLQDAFAAKGRGYGFTFPGYTSNPLTLFGPWLRLDYLFAGRGFQTVYCQTEPDRKSQHRAVAARFEVVEP